MSEEHQQTYKILHLAPTDFRTLGRSGLVVSPLALGTMAFDVLRWKSFDTANALRVGTAVPPISTQFITVFQKHFSRIPASYIPEVFSTSITEE